MSLFDTIEKMTGSKIIGKAEDKLAKKPNCKQVDGYCQYIKVNMDRIDKTIAELEIETKALVEQIQEKKGVKLSLREKSDLRKTKDKAGENLEYLYLIRDFFAVLTKNASGLMLKNEELMLVSKFAPYFDGVPVLEMDDDEDRDDSVLDTFKEVWRESKEAFFRPSKAQTALTLTSIWSVIRTKSKNTLCPMWTVPLKASIVLCPSRKSLQLLLQGLLRPVFRRCPPRKRSALTATQGWLGMRNSARSAANL